MLKNLTFISIGLLLINGFGPVILQNNTNLYNIAEYDLLIIAPNTFSSSIQPLINHKNSNNINTILKVTEQIFDEYQGRDNAEKIKFSIKDAVELWNVKYVLLIGGRKILSSDWHVPVRYSKINDGNGYTEFLSDLYFADIYKNNGISFEDWDSNGNGIFAEWGLSGDELDLYPDVAVGRLPCRSIKEVNSIVSKIIYYEENSFGNNWFKRFVAIGGDTFPDYEGYEGESTCDAAISFMNDFEITRLYTSNGNLTNSNDILDEINRGCGFLMTRGRGGQDRIRMVEPEGDEFIAFQNKDIIRLNNDGMYPICILGECIHGKFDVRILNIFKYIQEQDNYFLSDCIPECIAWRLVCEKDKGAIAAITNTNICYGTFGDQNNNGINDDAETLGGFLAVEIFRLYGEENITILGDLHIESISNYIANFPISSNKYHCKSIQEFVLIGDPSLKIGGYQ